MTDYAPLVSCIMPTADRRQFVPSAIEYFLRQDYAQRELIVLDDGADAVRDLMPDDARVRYIRLDGKRNVGAKRNLACREARGEIIVHWDDDDWMGPTRLSIQVGALLRDNADICGLDRVLFFAPATAEAWEYVYPESGRPWVYGASLCYRTEVWRRHPFAEVHAGEDSRFVWAAHAGRIARLADERILIAVMHPGNTSPKRTRDPRYRPQPLERVRTALGSDWGQYAPAASAAARTPARTALVSAAYGIGDLLRVTPLVRVLRGLDYAVDFLVAPDCPAAAQLFDGAPEVRRLIHYPNFRRNRGEAEVPSIAAERYDVAVFTAWSAPLQQRIRAEQSLVFSRAEWLAKGDLACVTDIARGLGWQGELPSPFAVASDRRFDLPAGTVALHPGCKRDWPWKKWHGFAELAARLPSVVVIGTEDDVDNSQTYFHRPFIWPEGVRDWTGQLSLPEVAALLRQCAALVSNDSGLMHLGVAMGTPTFGIFGITSPDRESIPAPHMVPISKGLACEAACRRQAWGRRDCEHHLQCMRTLTAEEVLVQVQRTLADIETPPARRPSPRLDTAGISVAYYANVFDASGYGGAARGYIRALDAAGIRVAVTDLSGRAPQVRDALVERLVGADPTADFHLFHGIPPQWAQTAFKLRNVIGMTVWETDTFPQRWRNVLNHALEVWLPCQFNVDVFNRALDRATFRLPHVVEAPADVVSAAGSSPPELREIDERDFVFYSIFEWQDRKSPEALLEAYLRACCGEKNAVLVVKANPGAAQVAERALQQLRASVASDARVVLACAAWTAEEIGALHARGDCYVSLHKGEGWGYPLFEAARRGTPIIATGYSGPLDYLTAEHHQLVRFELTPVRQPYAYYHPSMRWAAPDVAHATELMCWVREHRDAARAKAAAGARAIEAGYSLEAIGTRAAARLTQLLQRTNPQKWQRLAGAERRQRLRPTVPIPAEWYDDAYFELGLKSNWERGYRWADFGGLFAETAAFLSATFPDAESYLDAGCATGFLVRALREAGKQARGFDHSPWAIAHADPLARPHLELRGVDAASEQPAVDVLVAFNLLESLTEPQIDTFLRAARAWTRQAVFAVIASFTSEADRAQAATVPDRDLSHITMRTRQWWHEAFVRAGWKQDAVHRVAERMCRAHPLPGKMGWPVYLYAP